MEWLRKFCRFWLKLLFEFQIHNIEALREPGPVLLLPNHTSWLDWLFLFVCADDDWRIVTSSRTAETSPIHRWLMVNRRTFPIDAQSPYALKRMAEYLQGNGKLVLFPEGRLSRTGTLMKLFDGTGFLIYKSHAKVITCYIRGADRLYTSPNPNRKRLLPEISLHFSPVLTPALPEGVPTTEARGQLTRWLRDQMNRQQFEVEMAVGPQTVPAAIAATARRFPDRVVLEDITQALTYRRLMLGAKLLAHRWPELLRSSGDRVGVLLPNVNAAPVTLLSLWFSGRTPAVLNFSTGPSIMKSCADLAGLKQVITSRKFLERAKLDLAPLESSGVQFIYLEDVRRLIPVAEKLRGLIGLLPNPLSPFLDPESPAVVLFTSGSEGVPKGVELTHRNLLANVRQMLSVTDLVDGDRLFNALPIFHSFGLSIGTLLPLVRGFYTLLYPSPLHYRVVPTVFYERNCTIMVGTNTFLNGYARKAHPYDFRACRYLFAGAEKLQESTANVWARRFGARVLEGYGATECSPCLSVNTPLQPKFGSAGRFLPGIEYRLHPVEGVETGGRLQVRGPNIMRGYLNADANAQFHALGGWYDTGDIALVDEEGYVFIQGRLKRFAKVSGEMISLTAVEEALAGAFPHYGLRFQAAVIAVPDEEKGEALVVVTNEPHLRLDEVRAAIKARGLPNIAVPRSIQRVREISKLGTGKVNHRELERQLALADAAHDAR